MRDRTSLVLLVGTLVAFALFLLGATRGPAHAAVHKAPAAVQHAR